MYWLQGISKPGRILLSTVYNKHVRRCLFFQLKTRLFRLDPTFFGYNVIKQALLETLAPNYGIIPAKSFLFRSHKVKATGYYDIEKPLPDMPFFLLKTRLFRLYLIVCSSLTSLCSAEFKMIVRDKKAVISFLPPLGPEPGSWSQNMFHTWLILKY